MKRGLLYYPMYVNEFDEDPNVLAMDLAEVGLYLLALNESWKRGGIPDSPEDVARMIRHPLAKVRKAWPKVRACWAVNPETGMLLNPRQEKERKIALDKSAQAREAALKKHAPADASACAKGDAETTADSVPRASNSSSNSVSSSGLNASSEERTAMRAGVFRNDELFDSMIGAFLAAGVLLNEQDLIAAGFQWVSLPDDQKEAACSLAKQKAERRSAEHMGYPKNYLERREWTRTGPGRVLPQPRKKTSGEVAQEQAAEEFLRERGERDGAHGRAVNRGG